MTLLLSFILFIGTTTSEISLFTEYQKKIEKVVKKEFKGLDANRFVYKQIEEETLGLEAYEINVESTTIGYVFLKEAKACSLNGCTRENKEIDNLGSEYFDLAVIVDLKQNIRQVKVLNYFSDYGYEVSSKRYLKKYKGKSICYQSNSDIKIDGISGATISYNAILTSLDDFCQVLSTN